MAFITVILCPHPDCRQVFQVARGEENCRIFRCGVYRDSFLSRFPSIVLQLHSIYCCTQYIIYVYMNTVYIVYSINKKNHMCAARHGAACTTAPGRACSPVEVARDPLVHGGGVLATCRASGTCVVVLWPYRLHPKLERR